MPIWNVIIISTNEKLFENYIWKYYIVYIDRKMFLTDGNRIISIYVKN